MRRLTRFILIASLVLFFLCMGAVGFLAATVAGMGDIPDVETPLTSTFYDRNGKVLSTRFEQNRYEIQLNTLPDYVPKAFVAIEDHRFYDHMGVDIQALLRATFRNLREGRVVEGGSTITQQLAKNLFLTHDKTVSRKIQELLLTMQLERKYSKDEILEKYINTIYFGHSAYGIEAAAQTYFNKSASELTLGEAALLAGIPRGPAYYSPYISDKTKENALNRQVLILTRMAEHGYITGEQKAAAVAQELVFEGRDAQQAARQFGAYFIDYLINYEIMSKLADYTDDPQIIYRGGLHIYTTLDKDLQQKAESVFADPAYLPETITNDRGETIPLQAALVAMDPQDGAVLALMGGRDFRQSQFNRAVNKRSPGSAFKPFTYAAALENGYTAATVRDSAPVSYTVPGEAEPYEPTEYGEKFYGELRMREAIARSSNVIAIKINEELGPDRTVEMAKRLGIKSTVQPVLSNPLGSSEVTPLEMAAGYATFANQGVRVEPRFITRITDSGGRVIYEAGSVRRRAVLDADIAYIITDMMKSVFRPGGTAYSLAPLLNHPVAAKTGTSQGHRDSYMVGYSPTLVTSVWVGNDKNNSLGWGQTGSVRAGKVWANFMRLALANTQITEFIRPPGIVEILVCPHTGLLHNPRCSLQPIRELFIAGTEPHEQDSWPACEYCPAEPQWNWDGGWWFNRRQRHSQPEETPGTGIFGTYEDEEDEEWHQQSLPDNG